MTRQRSCVPFLFLLPLRPYVLPVVFLQHDPCTLDPRTRCVPHPLPSPFFSQTHNHFTLHPPRQQIHFFPHSSPRLLPPCPTVSAASPHLHPSAPIVCSLAFFHRELRCSVAICRSGQRAGWELAYMRKRGDEVKGCERANLRSYWRTLIGKVFRPIAC